MNEEILSRWIRTLTDTASDEPQTPFQAGLLKASKVMMNFVTGLALALLLSTGWITFMRFVTEALQIEIWRFGIVATLLTFFIPVVLAIRGAPVLQKVIFAARRYQVFNLIGIASVCAALLANIGPVMRCGVYARTAGPFLLSLFKFLADLFGVGELFALRAVDCK